jgi:hypothetical protein
MHDHVSGYFSHTLSCAKTLAHEGSNSKTNTCAHNEHMCNGYAMRVLFTEKRKKKDHWKGITEKKRSGIFL